MKRNGVGGRFRELLFASALTDWQKLAHAGFGGCLVILIYGYEYDGYPLAPVIHAFERLASEAVTLTSAAVAEFGDLVRPVHNRGAVYTRTVGIKNLSLGGPFSPQ